MCGAPLLFLVLGCGGLSESLWPTVPVDDGFDGDEVIWTQPVTSAPQTMPDYATDLPPDPMQLPADTRDMLQQRLCSGHDKTYNNAVFTALRANPESWWVNLLLDGCAPQPALCDHLFEHLAEHPEAVEADTLWHVAGSCALPRYGPYFLDENATDIAVLDWFAGQERQMRPQANDRAFQAALLRLHQSDLHGHHARLVAGAFPDPRAAKSIKTALANAPDDQRAGLAFALFRQTDTDSQARLATACVDDPTHYACVEGQSKLVNLTEVVRSEDVDLSALYDRFGAYRSTVDEALSACLLAAAVGDLSDERGLACASTLSGAGAAVDGILDGADLDELPRWKAVRAQWQDAGTAGLPQALVDRGLLAERPQAVDSKAPPVTAAQWMTQSEQGIWQVWRRDSRQIVHQLAAQIPALRPLWVGGRSAVVLQADSPGPSPEVFVWRDGQRLRALTNDAYGGSRQAIGMVNQLLVDAKASERVLLTDDGHAIWGSESALRKAIADGWFVAAQRQPTQVDAQDTGVMP
ncbi:MAG: hypothetical protein GWP91_07415 [Rhodobacterales bacterium]|nr:hypothetical protein [Rhodobacterales bacterium]